MLWIILSVIYLTTSLWAIALCVKYRGIYGGRIGIFILDLLFCLMAGPVALGLFGWLRLNNRL